MKSVSIAQSMIPSQRGTVQSCVNPREFSETDWQFNVNRAYQLDWAPGAAMNSNLNYFTQMEPHQKIKNGMFNPLTGREPIYGHTNYTLNPLDQEQTGSHMAAYQLQKQTRVADNMSPLPSMRFPPYQYPINTPTSAWVHSYQGSRSR